MSLERWLIAFGVDLRRLRKAIKNIPPYWRNWRKFKAQGSCPHALTNFPCLHDRDEASGEGLGHYFHQDFQVARKIFERSPQRHVDVGSRLDGFVAHLAVFRSVDYVDLRPPPDDIDNITFRFGDLLRAETLPNNCESVSCLHVIEHVGLGRYGDDIDVDGWRKSIASLASMLAPNGCLFLSTPIGNERVDFDAHRVFNVDTIIKEAELHGLRLKSFAWVNDEGRFEGWKTFELSVAFPVEARGLRYGCGIFEFTCP